MATIKHISGCGAGSHRSSYKSLLPVRSRALGLGLGS
jgi:beta-glucosidase-like glycosyl hydrolase